MEAAKDMQIQEMKAPRLVMFPLPFQGHINPMIQLATLLHSKGFSITIIHTHFNAPNPSNFPNFHFECISDGLSNDQALNLEPLTLASILNETCQVPFEDCLSRLLSDGTDGLIKCIITDVVLHFTGAVAKKWGLPRIVLRTNSASSSGAVAAYKLRQEKGNISIKDQQPDALVSEFLPLRIKDLPDYSLTDPEMLERLVANVKNSTKASSGFIVNTFDSIEASALEKFRKGYHPLPIFAIGPLHKFSPGASNSLLKQDHSCITWLDKQAPHSVMYVSFGSLASINKTDVVEIAWGLANSDQAFLWVVRPGSIRGDDWVELPEGFEEKTRERGWIVKWAPQQEVLAHPSVGGFWTHNGWNSTLESICEGVPMLCCPYLWDQKVNARYVSYVWRVGLQLENGFERGEMEWAIRRLMVETEGKEIRERVSGLKENAISCLRRGGSSHESLESLIDLIMSF
ncbi:UDP-glycosyltransferase 76B1-like [Magnolia sinica]|uniref:UDP-glycosyltransferase 76B1-like n=1 Tax=Magnolia sinica TaxID=86752 RepID=UPI00265B42C0|nr:UDP-glycosyltransferase 76B1-like [Magnolia sinica]